MVIILCLQTVAQISIGSSLRADFLQDAEDTSAEWNATKLG